MIKNLISIAFALLAVGANAQQTTCVIYPESLEKAGIIDSYKSRISGGVVFGDGPAGTIATAYEDEWGMMSPSGSYKNVRIDKVNYTLNYGVVGNTNPVFTNYASGVMSAGAVFEISPVRSGWLTLFARINPNKQYVVFEGETGAVAYTLGYSNGSDKIFYSLPSKDNYYIDFNADDASKYFMPVGGEIGSNAVKPLFPSIVYGYAPEDEWGRASLKDNTGFLTFRVEAGRKYYFSALGSKVPCGPYVITERDEMPIVTFLATEELPEVTFDPNDLGSGVIPGEGPGDNPEDNPGEEPGDNPDEGLIDNLPDDFDPNRITCEATAESLRIAGFEMERMPKEGRLVFAKGAAGTLATAYPDEWRIFMPCGAYKNVRVNDVDLTLEYGVVGNSNPYFPNYAQGFSDGAAFVITPTKDGWVTLFTRLNPNKPYMITEGSSGPMSYTLGWSDGSQMIYYTLPSDSEDYYIDFNAGDASTYFTPQPGGAPDEVRPQYPWVVAGMGEAPRENTGFITFRVKAGESYYFGAYGSKAPCGSFVLTEGDERPTVTFFATESLPGVTFDPNYMGSGEVPDDNPGEQPDDNPEVKPDLGSIDNLPDNFDPDRMTCEATFESLELAGFVSEGKIPIEGRVVFAKGAVGTIATAYPDNWGINAPRGSYQNVKVGDVDLTLSYGAVGDWNPTFTNYAGGVMSAGAVFEITPTKDGWLTLFTKMNPNKQYVVFEGKDKPLAYTLGYSNGTEKIYYTLPHDENYLIDFEDYVVAGHELEFYYDDTPKYSYFVGAGGELGSDEVKPNFPWKVAGMNEPSSDNNGFLTFPVSAGKTYYFGSLGSKATCGSFVLTESDEMPTVTFLATEDHPTVVFDPNDMGSVVKPDEKPEEKPDDEPEFEPGDAPEMDLNPDRMICEATEESLAAAGLVKGDKLEINSGVIFAEGKAGTMATAFDDNWGITPAYGSYRYVRVGDTDLVLSDGAAGNSNPGFYTYLTGFEYGSVVEIVPEKDGWVTVFTKMRANKQYVVMDGLRGPMSYTLGWSNGKQKIHYTLPRNEYYWIDFYAQDAYSYFIPFGDRPEEVRPQFPYVVAGMDENPGDDTGFLTFNVLAGVSYYLGAIGTKVPCGAFVLTEAEEEPEVTFLAHGTFPEVTFTPMYSDTNEEPGDEQPGDEEEVQPGDDPEDNPGEEPGDDPEDNPGEEPDDAGVEGIYATQDEDNIPVYNIMGQQVGPNAKGLLIKNGKKFIRR
ncbi:MAG: hypothetical protein J1E16_00810 [Muribaculaceae bacterium]|nr:hypothetical protein [Muribaculaceae bacterium]